MINMYKFKFISFKQKIIYKINITLIKYKIKIFL